MHSLAAASTPAAIPQIPIEWITSGAVSPVSPGVASPAAAVTTGWTPQPAYVDPTGGSGMLDAIASAMLGTAPTTSAQAQAQAQAQANAQAAQVQAQQLPVTAPQVAVVPMVVAPGVVAPVQVVAPPTAPVAAPVAVSAPAAGAAAAPQDPTLVGSVTGALAGFASATGRAIGDVAGAGVSKARKVGTELWAGVRSPRAIHVSQVPSKYNAAPAAGNKDCGPASVVMTLKLLGKSIPGVAANAAPQKLINRVRALAGNVANSAATTNHELGRALRAAGTKTREIADAGSIRRAIMAGKPVILNGNPRNPGAYGPSFSAAQMTPYSGGHWIVVSGFDQKSGKFIVNDPLSKVGPVKVSPSQLEAYRAGSMGIEVQA
jgi:hypothetical protein